jgi:hypothetical protein
MFQLQKLSLQLNREEQGICKTNLVLAVERLRNFTYMFQRQKLYIQLKREYGVYVILIWFWQSKDYKITPTCSNYKNDLFNLNVNTGYM